MKYRIWWLEESPMNDDEWYGYDTQQTDDDIKVIEYSAYKNALKMLDILDECLKYECCCPGETSWATGEQIECDPCEARKKYKAWREF